MKFTLTAQETRIRLSSGRTVDAWTFNGQAPGPELRMHQGDLVEVTLVNRTHDLIPRTLVLTGTPFRVTAIDGVDLNQPSDLENAAFEMAIGGRYDVVFTMPDHPVRLTDLLNPMRVACSVPDPFRLSRASRGPSIQPLRSPVPAHSRRQTGFLRRSLHLPADHQRQGVSRHTDADGRRGRADQDHNHHRGHQDHPMHLHGHHVLVLSRNRKPVSGSPWWTDTLEVLPGQIYEVAFRADNPGIWMDHCHNLAHAATGMVMHLAYHGVTSPYQVGHATKNHPE